MTLEEWYNSYKSNPKSNKLLNELSKYPMYIVPSISLEGNEIWLDLENLSGPDLTKKLMKKVSENDN